MGLLRLEHVGKTHRVGPYEKRVLADVSLAVHRGEVSCVWGAQRSGKSTLLRIAAGLERPDTGRVSFDGRDLAALPDETRHRLRLGDIGLVRSEGPQSSSLPMLDYVALPLLARCTMREARQRARVALARVDVAECADALWEQLSDSERTLVSLAHGIGRDPRLLLVDDPTVRLDTFQQGEFVELLRAVAAERRIAVLMTSSVLSATTDAHEAFTLSDGRVIPVTDEDRPGADIIEFRRDQRAG